MAAPTIFKENFLIFIDLLHICVLYQVFELVFAFQDPLKSTLYQCLKRLNLLLSHCYFYCCCLMAMNASISIEPTAFMIRLFAACFILL